MNSNALKNGIFSLIIPGLGQFLTGDKQNAVKFFALAIALHIFVWFFMNNPIGSLANTAYHVYAGYDAYKKS